MKLVWKISIPLIIEGIILAIIGIWIVAILNQSWWWFFGTLIFFIIVDLTILIIFGISRWKKKKPLKMKSDPKTEKQKVINEMKYDTENPDNFKIRHSKLERLGAGGAERTPVLTIDGTGTEKNERRVVIVNMNNTKEKTWLTNPSDEEVKREADLMAENPSETTEEKSFGTDEFGRPVTRITRKPTFMEKKEHEEAKKIENEAGM